MTLTRTSPFTPTLRLPVQFAFAAVDTWLASVDTRRSQSIPGDLHIRGTELVGLIYTLVLPRQWSQPGMPLYVMAGSWLHIIRKSPGGSLRR